MTAHPKRPLPRAVHITPTRRPAPRRPESVAPPVTEQLWLPATDGRLLRVPEFPFVADDQAVGYGALPRPTTRHLLYHCYPRRGSEYRKRLLALREVLPLFNGHKRIAIVTDGTCDPVEWAADQIAAPGVQIIKLRNNPDRREVETFLPLFNDLAADTSPNSCTFYGHAKGVSRGDRQDIRWWTESLEELCWYYWPLVERLLTHYAAAGPFKELGRGWTKDLSLSVWHYSGTFFWFRNDCVFTDPDWRVIDQFWSGMESWLSLHVHPAAAGTIFGQGSLIAMDMYYPQTWRDTIFPALGEFKKRTPRVLPQEVANRCSESSSNSIVERTPSAGGEPATSQPSCPLPISPPQTIPSGKPSTSTTAKRKKGRRDA